jgi:hypothetical protein
MQARGDGNQGYVVPDQHIAGVECGRGPSDEDVIEVIDDSRGKTIVRRIDRGVGLIIIAVILFGLDGLGVIVFGVRMSFILIAALACLIFLAGYRLIKK